MEKAIYVFKEILEMIPNAELFYSIRISNNLIQLQGNHSKNLIRLIQLITSFSKADVDENGIMTVFYKHNCTFINTDISFDVEFIIC